MELELNSSLAQGKNKNTGVLTSGLVLSHHVLGVLCYKMQSVHTCLVMYMQGQTSASTHKCMCTHTLFLFLNYIFPPFLLEGFK